MKHEQGEFLFIYFLPINIICSFKPTRHFETANVHWNNSQLSDFKILNITWGTNLHWWFTTLQDCQRGPALFRYLWHAILTVGNYLCFLWVKVVSLLTTTVTSILLNSTFQSKYISINLQMITNATCRNGT